MMSADAGTSEGHAPDGGDATAAQGVPNAADGLLADRQVLWGSFTKLILWSIIGVVVLLVLLDWSLL